MTPTRRVRDTLRAALRRGWHDQRGANAVEFAILAMPFFGLLFFIMQIGLFNLTKMALDAGLLKESEYLQAQFNGTGAPTLPNGSNLKTGVAGYSGGLVGRTSALKVEIRPLSALSTAPVAITDQFASYGSANVVLALRASYTLPVVIPGMSGVFVVQSSALVRRQSQ